MTLEHSLREAFLEVFEELYGQKPVATLIQFQKTRPEFPGDLTINVFPFLKLTGKSPEATAQSIGEMMLQKTSIISGFNVVKGFLNIVVADSFWVSVFSEANADSHFGSQPVSGRAPVVVEYSSPNTNKPLHLGHVRNNLLGWSVAEILKASGKRVVKVNLVNDRGIHICKSMLAWQKFGEGKSPADLQMKGDKLVGEMYVRFDKELKAEVETLTAKGVDKEDAAKKSVLMAEAQQMLRKWEEADPEIRYLWSMMNGWVYKGFDLTYKRLGVDFDKIYYESETYLLGKTLVGEGLKSDVLTKKEDGSVWCDLTAEGLDEKLLLRADGTSVYMTQDLGTAQLRVDDYQPEKLIYVVGNEQNYHFDVLRLILRKLGRAWADQIEHLSYGMVELPHGRMKSREGTVVDADELMEEMVETAKSRTTELGKIEGLSDKEASELFETIGLGALKYFILKVDPKKTMVFNPEESIDFNGNTGPFIQYTHARIKSIERKAAESGIDAEANFIPPAILHEKEKNLIKLIYQYPSVIQQAATNQSPALVANYVYDLAKEFNQFYQEHSILKEPDTRLRLFRLILSRLTSKVIKSAGALLGIHMPDRM
ncbi:MAG: arginine--tRNA ligase [Bacteroidales bacterium]|nr:arginine--tRNA ligase [Bacteroidales bacterium]